MLSIVKECRGGGLLSRHRAWWREGEQTERGGAYNEDSVSDFFWGYLRGYIFILGIEKMLHLHQSWHHHHHQLPVCLNTLFLTMGQFGFVQTFKGHFGPEEYLPFA